MTQGFVTTGTLSQGRRVDLDEDVPLGDTQVRVTIERLRPSPRLSINDVTTAIRRSQEARGYQPPSLAEVDRAIAEERAAWNE